MRTDFDHIISRKQLELPAALRILCEEFITAISGTNSLWKSQGRILKVVPYGSHARGDLVEDPFGGYESDYDL